MSTRPVPPLPSKKPPVPLSFKLSQLFGGAEKDDTKMPLPPLSFTGGAAAPATSGGIGTQGNIGNTTITKTGGISVWKVGIFVLGYLAWKKWGK